MMSKISVRLYAAVAILIATASPALAQFKPRPMSEPPPLGERYHIEFGAGFWNPSSDMSISSESLGIVGSTINFKTDLGLTDSRFSQLKAVLRPAKKHKFRFQLIPIKYSQKNHSLTRTIVFNGQAYTVGLPINSELDWKAYRFAYEYDFLYREKWFAGVVVDVKYTDVKATLTSAIVNEFAHAQGPIPALGGIGRYYFTQNISITGELTDCCFNVPEKISEDINAHYLDFDMYGTVNFTNNIGAQVGWRKFDLGYHFDADNGAFVLKGLYFGVVARY